MGEFGQLAHLATMIWEFQVWKRLANNEMGMHMRTPLYS
jgi:hypothetical protein